MAAGDPEFVLEDVADCSWRSFRMASDLSCFHSLPSFEYQTSLQFFDGLFNQPPRTKM